MFKLIKIQLKIFASLQTLFPPLKIDIFCRIAPLSFIKKVIKIQLENLATLENFWTPANAVSSFENWHFLLHRPPYFSLRIWNESSWKNLYPCKRWFSLWKSPFSDASPPYYLPMFPTNYAHMFPTNYAQTSPNRISPSRNSLCRENRIRGARAARMAGCAE